MIASRSYGKRKGRGIFFLQPQSHLINPHEALNRTIERYDKIHQLCSFLKQTNVTEVQRVLANSWGFGDISHTSSAYHTWVNIFEC